MRTTHKQNKWISVKKKVIRIELSHLQNDCSLNKSIWGVPTFSWTSFWFKPGLESKIYQSSECKASPCACGSWSWTLWPGVGPAEAPGAGSRCSCPGGHRGRSAWDHNTTLGGVSWTRRCQDPTVTFWQTRLTRLIAPTTFRQISDSAARPSRCQRVGTASVSLTGPSCSVSRCSQSCFEMTHWNPFP